MVLSSSGMPELFDRPLVNLTLETETTTSAILKWTGSNRSLSDVMTSYLSIHRLSTTSRDSRRRPVVYTVSASNFEIQADVVVGWYEVDELVPGTLYSAQLVADVEPTKKTNISNIVFFGTRVDGNNCHRIRIGRAGLK